MSKTSHTFLVVFYVTTIFFSIIILLNFGLNYYRTPISDRPFQLNYEILKPSGILSHGLGIVGGLLIVFGIGIYVLRKRWKRISKSGKLKNWLEFHIFLCTWGTVLVLFHTTFKFGGIISVGFWALILVWTSGFIGKFIYSKIPRTIKGKELSLSEVKTTKSKLDNELMEKYNLNFADIKMNSFFRTKKKQISKFLSAKDIRDINQIRKQEQKLEFVIGNLTTLKKWFYYWHIVHIYFTITLLVLLSIHISVAIFFGYTWIFS